MKLVWFALFSLTSVAFAGRPVVEIDDSKAEEVEVEEEEESLVVSRDDSEAESEDDTEADGEEDSEESSEVESEEDSEEEEFVTYCTDSYRKLDSSIMCEPDSPDYVRGSAVMTDKDVRDILKQHNKYRKAASPTAGKMMKMHWDCQLALTAEKWARQCFQGHDSPQKKDRLKPSRYIPDYGMASGQNMAFGQFKNWFKVVNLWHKESQIFRYGEDPEDYIGNDGWKEIANYTQVVQDSAVLVGCAYARCTTGPEHFYFCNYLTASTNYSHPYTEGSYCSECTGKCLLKYCDCDGKFCFNGGTQNLTTCECTCKYPFTGEDCLTKSCESNRADPSQCSSYQPSECDYSITVPAECPVLCGLCPGGDNTPKDDTTEPPIDVIVPK